MLKRTKGEKIFAVFNTLFLTGMLIATLYPCLYVLFASISDPVELYSGSKILLCPRGFNLTNYAHVLKNSMLWIGYRNTIFYTVAGTLLNVSLTIVAAYCLSRRGLPGKNFILMAIVFTMYFSGGMIPTYLVVKNLHLLDKFAALILPGAINTSNFIIMLSFFRGLPGELEEAAKIDGANNYLILIQVMIPLSKACIAVIALYYAVEHWNSYMPGLLYINNMRKYPLQLVLREILLEGSAQQNGVVSIDDADAVAETIKYATMVVSTVPMLCVYPFIQRYFVKGVMIGAIKG
ncbi:MAG: carbohydrate ABC transporter permease [Clostridia bacterium]|nr:carbohydrate ABC transporter permease [Clostridia bacterium]